MPWAASSKLARLAMAQVRLCCAVENGDPRMGWLLHGNLGNYRLELNLENRVTEFYQSCDVCARMEETGCWGVYWEIQLHSDIG